MIRRGRSLFLEGRRRRRGVEMELVRGDVCYITFGCRGVGVGVGGGYEWKEG